MLLEIAPKPKWNRELNAQVTIEPRTFTHTQPFYGSLDFGRDNLGELVPEETFAALYFEIFH